MELILAQLRALGCDRTSNARDPHLALAWTRGRSLRIVELIWPAETADAAYGRPALFRSSDNSTVGNYPADLRARLKSMDRRHATVLDRLDLMQ